MVESMNTLVINDIEYAVNNIDQSPLLSSMSDNVLTVDASNEDVATYVQYLKTGNITINFNPALFKFMGHDIADDNIEYSKVRLMDNWNGEWYGEHGYELDQSGSIEILGPLACCLKPLNVDYCHDGMSSHDYVHIGILNADDVYSLLQTLFKKLHDDKEIIYEEHEDKFSISFPHIHDLTYDIIPIDDICDMSYYTYNDIIHGKKYYRSIVSVWKASNEILYKELLFKEFIKHSHDANNNTQLLQWSDQIPELEEYIRGNTLRYTSTEDINGTLHIHPQGQYDIHDIMDILSGRRAGNAIIYPIK